MLCLAVGLLLTLLGGVASATVISYRATDLGGDYWRYDYTVSNDSLATPITEFFIDFDFGLYDLLLPATTSGWTTQTADPAWTATGPWPGFYNAIALDSGIAAGGSAGGFSVSFLWLNPGTSPADQTFSVLNNGQLVDAGWTVPATDTAPVPEPGTLLLMGGGLLGVFVLGKLRQKIEMAA
jgi:hypothetical protein